MALLCSDVTDRNRVEIVEQRGEVRTRGGIIIERKFSDKRESYNEGLTIQCLGMNAANLQKSSNHINEN